MISLWGLIYRHLLTPKMVSRLSYNSQAEAAAGDSSSTYVHTTYSLDGMLKMDFLLELINDAFYPPNHKTYFEFCGMYYKFSS